MTGYNMFNQTPTTASPFTAPTMNATSAFAAPQAQQNVSFGDSNTATTQSGFSFGGGSLQSGSLSQQQAKNVFARVGGFGSAPAAAPTFGSAAPTMTGFAFPGTGTSQTTGFNPAPATSQSGGIFSSAVATSQTSPFAPTPATSQTGSIFAPAPATPQIGSMFAPASATPQTSSIFASTTPQAGSLFAPSAATSQAGAFAAPSATPQQGLSFGAPAAAPQAGATFGSGSTLSQVTFGAPQASAAATPQTSSIFAAPSATPQLGLTTSGAATAPQTGATFGSGSTLSQVSFGVPAASTAATSQPSIASGVLTSTTSTSLQTGPSAFAAPAATTTQSTVGQVSQPLLGFGTTPSVSVAPTPAATTAAPGLTFGMPTSTAQPTLSFGTGSTLSTTTTSASALFPSSTTTATSSAFPSLGSSSTTPASTATPLFGNLTSTATTSTTAAPTGIFAMPTPATDSSATVTSATTTSIGLGGVDHSTVTTTQSAANTITSVKEQLLPNEIQQTVMAFKEHVKLQKSLSSEVARMSSEPLVKLTKQINVIDNLIINLGSVLSQQKFTAEKMKLETIKALNDYELVQKIKDSPVASEERLLSIRKYFLEKISSFEESTKTLQEKIEYVYQHVNTLPQENSLSAEALKLIVKKLHDSFVAIGARTYKLHNDMQLLKVQYMTIRNQYVKDKSPIPFSLHREVELPAETRAQSSELSLEGPSPFSKTGNGSLNSLLLMSQNKSAVASSSSSSVVGSILNTSRPLGLTDASSTSIFDQSSLPGTNQQFNLQKPPFGTKRGKR